MGKIYIDLYPLLRTPCCVSGAKLAGRFHLLKVTLLELALAVMIVMAAEDGPATYFYVIVLCSA